ncbi:hypothetical protein LA6_001342 [Marinibacterium anthonyi]|nr:hypothetical protein LA6_001342 [Marinibacterium anthonyi]
MRWGRWIACAGVALALAACEDIPQATTPPRPKPEPPSSSPRPQPVEQSDTSMRVSQYYARRQADLLTRGLLRTDGGGPDTPYSADDLARDYEAIVFYDEYASGIGSRHGTAGRLRRWEQPVGIDVEFGASVPGKQRREDAAQIGRYATRLSRITNHPVARTQGNANFHVLVMGEDDKAQLTARLRELAPTMSDDTVAFYRDMPLTIECSVLAFSSGDSPYAYTMAIAVIRAELPDLLRQSCIHEEISQGLGPANDSPDARPSIFNDDDEFALLTSHDEMILRMLYDPRMTVGMTAEDGRATARIIARELMGQDL